jgi:hypothetical protein
LATYEHFAGRNPLNEVVRPLSDLRLAVIMLDGIELHGYTNIVALGDHHRG